MNLVIYVNTYYEEEQALFDKDKKRVMLIGDYYHDKIDEKIDGYLQALRDFNIYDENVESVLIDKTHEHYDLIGFDVNDYDD